MRSYAFIFANTKPTSSRNSRIVIGMSVRISFLKTFSITWNYIAEIILPSEPITFCPIRLNIRLYVCICMYEINFKSQRENLLNAMSTVEYMVKEFAEADNAIRSVFNKVDPVFVVRVYFDQKQNVDRLYTLEIKIKPGQNLEAIREHIIRETGMAPGFYLGGTKIIVTQKLDLKTLKIINDFEEVLEIRGSPYGAGGATDF